MSKDKAMMTVMMIIKTFIIIIEHGFKLKVNIKNTFTFTLITTNYLILFNK